MVEQWKEISICPQYEVSNLGNVRKYGRQLTVSKNGTVKLEHGRDFTIRNLVWTHFKGVRPKMHSIKLIDESKPASVDNLQAVRLKQMYVADPQRTPADCERLAVHLYVKDKLSVGKIAREIGVHESTVYNILRRAGVKTRGKFVKKGKSYV